MVCKVVVLLASLVLSRPILHANLSETSSPTSSLSNSLDIDLWKDIEIGQPSDRSHSLAVNDDEHHLDDPFISKSFHEFCIAFEVTIMHFFSVGVGLYVQVEKTYSTNGIVPITIKGDIDAEASVGFKFLGIEIEAEIALKGSMELEVLVPAKYIKTIDMLAYGIQSLFELRIRRKLEQKGFDGKLRNDVKYLLTKNHQLTTTEKVLRKTYLKNRALQAVEEIEKYVYHKRESDKIITLEHYHEKVSGAFAKSFFHGSGANNRTGFGFWQKVRRHLTKNTAFNVTEEKHEDDDDFIARRTMAKVLQTGYYLPHPVPDTFNMLDNALWSLDFMFQELFPPAYIYDQYNLERRVSHNESGNLKEAMELRDIGFRAWLGGKPFSRAVKKVKTGILHNKDKLSGFLEMLYDDEKEFQEFLENGVEEEIDCSHCKCGVQKFRLAASVNVGIGTGGMCDLFDFVQVHFSAAVTKEWTVREDLSSKKKNKCVLGKPTDLTTFTQQLSFSTAFLAVSLFRVSEHGMGEKEVTYKLEYRVMIENIIKTKFKITRSEQKLLAMLASRYISVIGHFLKTLWTEKIIDLSTVKKAKASVEQVRARVDEMWKDLKKATKGTFGDSVFISNLVGNILAGALWSRDDDDWTMRQIVSVMSKALRALFRQVGIRTASLLGMQGMVTCDSECRKNGWKISSELDMLWVEVGELDTGNIPFYPGLSGKLSAFVTSGNSISMIRKHIVEPIHVKDLPEHNLERELMFPIIGRASADDYRCKVFSESDVLENGETCVHRIYKVHCLTFDEGGMRTFSELESEIISRVRKLAKKNVKPQLPPLNDGRSIESFKDILVDKVEFMKSIEDLHFEPSCTPEEQDDNGKIVNWRLLSEVFINACTPEFIKQLHVMKLYESCDSCVSVNTLTPDEDCFETSPPGGPKLSCEYQRTDEGTRNCDDVEDDIRKAEQ